MNAPPPPPPPAAAAASHRAAGLLHGRLASHKLLTATLRPMILFIFLLPD